MTGAAVDVVGVIHDNICVGISCPHGGLFRALHIGVAFGTGHFFKL